MTSYVAPEDKDPRLHAILDRIPSEWGKWISCGEGWFDLIVQLDSDLAALKPDYRIAQVKEKFASLSFYLEDESDWDDADLRAARDLIRAAEVESKSTCESCGAEGRVGSVGKGWISVHCISCAPEKWEPHQPWFPWKGES